MEIQGQDGGWFGKLCPVNDLGFDAVAGDKSPAFAVEEAGPDFAIGKVDKDGLVGVGRGGGGLPVDGGFHFCLSFWLLL